ncbi:MAG: AarF/UbiB family protein [Patescibacteria group bacterium]
MSVLEAVAPVVQHDAVGRNSGEQLANQVDAVIDQLLCRYEQFPPDSALYQFVAGRIDVLCEGEDFDKPELIVVRDGEDDVTAYSTPGYLVIGSGILKKLEHQEEIDGLLAHELTHEAHEHVARGQAKAGYFERVGHARASEFEADMRPLELLDRKGINPWGIVSLFNRFEATKKEAPVEPERPHAGRKPAVPKIRTEDVEHGSISDRRVNVEEILRIADVRNLAPGGLTPLAFEEQDFNSFQRDTDLIAGYGTLGTDDKRRLVVRQLKSTLKAPESERQAALDLASKFIEEIAPDLGAPDKELAVTLLDKSLLPKKLSAGGPFYSVLKSLLNIEQVDTTAPTPTDIISSLERILDHEGLQKHRISPENRRIIEAGAEILSDSISAHQIVPPVRDFCELIKKFAAAQRGTEDDLWVAALRVCLADSRSQVAREYIMAAADHTPTSSTIIDPELYTTGQVIGEGSELKSEEIFFLVLSLEKQRINRALQEHGDVVELLQTAGSFGSNLGYTSEYDAYGDSNYSPDTNTIQQSEEPNGISIRLQEELSSISPAELLDLVRVHRKSGVLQNISDRRFADVLWEEINRYEQDDPDRPQNPASMILDKASLKEGLALVSLLASKHHLINFANKRFETEVMPITEYIDNKEFAVAAKIFLRHMKTIIGVNKNLAELGFENSWEVNQADFAQMPAVQMTAFRLIAGLVSNRNVSQALRIAELVPLPSIDELGKTADSDIYGQWEQAVNKLIQKDTQKPEELMLLAVLTASSPNLHDRIDLPPRILQKLVEMLSFEDAVDFVCDGMPALPRPLFFEALSDLIETRAHTPEEFAYLSQRIGARLHSFIDQQSSGIGKASLVDGILLPNYGEKDMVSERKVGIKHDTVRGLEATQLLLAMLSTVRDDSQLQRYMLSRWWTLMRTNRTIIPANADTEDDFDPTTVISDLAEIFKVEDIAWMRGDHKQARRDHWANSVPDQHSGYKPFQEVLDSAYRSGVGHKYYVLRKLLLDEEYGVLRSDSDSSLLIDKFLDNWLADPNDESAQFVRESLGSLVAVTNPELLYQHLYPLLMDIVLLPPEEQTDTKTFASELARQLFDDFLARGILGDMKPDGPEAISTLAALDQKVRCLVTGQAQVSQTTQQRIEYAVLKRYQLEIKSVKDNAAEADLLRHTIRSEVQQMLEQEQTRLIEIQGQSVSMASISHALRTRFAPETTSVLEGKRMSALDLLFTLGERSGSLGTRMLQLGGMYFDMPEEQREKFAHVYDDMKGQTRLQAWRILEREAAAFPAVQSLFDNLVELKPRIGGGSLMTVYEAVDTQGNREAIAIKNPNIEYQVGKLVVVLDRMLEDLQLKRADEYRIGLVRSLLVDVAEWINDELADPTFEIKDEQFRASNDFRNGGYRPAKNRYQVMVPKSVPTGTRWVRREKYIEGHNLSGFEVVEQESNIPEGKINGADYKEAISLLVHNYVYQLTETGLVHSDVHPGNFRITADNKSLAVFDRYNLLEFSESERGMLKQVLRTVATGDTTAGMNGMVNFILSLPDNSQTDHALVRQVVDQATAQASDLAESGPKVLLALKQNGVRVPIKYTLVMKNILSLQRLSKRAGFSGIAEAFVASADPSEVVKLLNYKEVRSLPNFF